MLATEVCPARRRYAPILLFESFPEPNTFGIISSFTRQLIRRPKLAR